MKLDLVVSNPNLNTAVPVTLNRENLLRRIRYHNLEDGWADKLHGKVERFMEFFWEDTLWGEKKLNTSDQIQTFMRDGWELLPTNAIHRKIILEMTFQPIVNIWNNNFRKEIISVIFIRSKVIIIENHKDAEVEKNQYFFNEYLTVLSFFFFPEFIQGDVNRDLFKSLMVSFNKTHLDLKVKRVLQNLSSIYPF